MQGVARNFESGVLLTKYRISDAGSGVQPPDADDTYILLLLKFSHSW